MRSGIDWREVGAGGRFEQIVSVLLSTLHPGSRRIDGSGGDGGRDHQFEVDGRLELWQSKYFLGRLAEKGRKRQVTDSLLTAAALQPDSWTLVTPMVPTPEELAWLRELQHQYPFPLDWKGGDWLDAELMLHPSIVRHFNSANDEYVALLRELSQEQEALVDGLPAARERLENLAGKINGSNPFYDLILTLDSGRVTSAGLRAKYPGADVDSPITIRFAVVVGSEPADAQVSEALENALSWGEQATLPATHVKNLVVDAPHGLGHTADQAVLTIGPAESEPVVLDLQLAVWAPDGQKMAALPARLLERVRGQRGVTVKGQDLTGVVNVQLRLDEQESRESLNLRFNEPPPLVPSTLLPVLRFMKMCVAPNKLSFDLKNPESSWAVEIPTSYVPALDDYVTFVEGLDRVQRTAMTPFPVPAQWTGRDALEVRRAVRLLDGERVRIGGGPANFSLEAEVAGAFREATKVSERHTIALAASESFKTQICGYTLDLGPCIFYIEAATLEIDETADESGGYAVTVHPGDGYGVEVGLGHLQDDPGQPRAPRDL